MRQNVQTIDGQKSRSCAGGRVHRYTTALLALCSVLGLPGVEAAPEAEGSESPDAAVCPHPPEALIVLRHACKATRCPSSMLSDVGRRQARNLARDLASYSVDAIFVTTSERTQETAAALADRIGQSVECGVADPARRCLHDEPRGIDDLLEEVCSGNYSDRLVLHVGHFHTLPRLFSRLGMKGPRSYLSAKPWKIEFDQDGRPSYEELPLEHTTPLGSRDCGTTACGETADDG